MSRVTRGAELLEREAVGGTRRAVSFELRAATSGRMLLARVHGPLGMDTVPEFLERLLPLCEGMRRVVLDLRTADYLDSQGVRALLLLQERLRAAGGELRLVCLPASTVSRVIRLLQLHEVFPLFDGVHDAWIRSTAAQ